MNGRLIGRLISVFAAALICPGAAADTVNVMNGPYRVAPGGEFQMTPVSGFAGIVGLPSDVSASTFQTFCIERDEVILGTGAVGGATVDFSIATSAVGGGYGGGSPDPISAQTAYLYTQFRSGSLSNYSFGGTVAQRKASAEALQIAIWILEDEYTGSFPSGSAPVNQQASDWVTEANNLVAGAWGNTIGDVRVLNLVQNGVNAQSMLTIIPLPPAAWAGAIVLAAMSGGAWVRRRRLKGVSS